MNSQPPYFNNAYFNTMAFGSSDYLTQEEGSRLYLPLSYADLLNYVSGITPGIVSASKAVIVDANKDITGYRHMTVAGNLSGYSLNLTGYSLNLTNVTTVNNTCVWTLGSQPTVSNGVGIRFNGLADGGTGYLRAYNYVLSQDNNLSINNGNIYIKNDRNIGIDVARASIAYKLDVNGDVNCSGNFRVAGTIMSGISSAQATLLSATAGIASASKALIVDASKNINSIALLKPDFIQNNYNGHSMSGFIDFKADTTNFFDGDYQRMLFLRDSSNTQQFQILVNSTTKNTWVGNLNSSELRFGVGNSTKLTIGNNGLTTISGSYTYNIFTSGDNYSRLSATNCTFNTASGNVSANIGCAFTQSIVVNGGNCYVASDKRLKREIETSGLIDELTDSFMEINPCSFIRRDSGILQIGFIAQDFLHKNIKYLGPIVSGIQNKEMHAGDDEFDIEGMQLTVDYSHCVPLLLNALKKLSKRVNNITNRVEFLEE